MVVEEREIDERLRRRAGRQRLFEIIFVDDAAADGVGLGQAIAEQRLAVAHLGREAADMLGRTRRAAAGIAFARRQVVVLAVRADEDFIAHRSEEHTSELQSLMRTSYA